MAKDKLREKVQIEGKAWTFVVSADDGWTLIDPDGKHVPAPGLMPQEDIDKLRAKAQKGTN